MLPRTATPWVVTPPVLACKSSQADGSKGNLGCLFSQWSCRYRRQGARRTPKHAARCTVHDPQEAQKDTGVCGAAGQGLSSPTQHVCLQGADSGCSAGGAESTASLSGCLRLVQAHVICAPSSTLTCTKEIKRTVTMKTLRCTCTVIGIGNPTPAHTTYLRALGAMMACCGITHTDGRHGKPTHQLQSCRGTCPTTSTTDQPACLRGWVQQSCRQGTCTSHGPPHRPCGLASPPCLLPCLWWLLRPWP